MKFRWETEFKKTEIGEIPRDWGVRRLGDIFKIQYGRGLIEKERSKGDIPVFGSSGIVGYHNKPLAKGPGIIIGRKGNIGKVYYSKSDFYPIDTVFYVEKIITAKYIYYALNTFDLEQLMSDSAVPGLNINFLNNANIPYPPLHEQTRIATILSWFDDLIENKKRQNEILEKTAIAIFKSWFIDFEPFRKGEFVYNEVLGKEIPKGWEVKAIGDVAEIVKGKKCKIQNFQEQAAKPYLLIENFINYTVDTYWTYDETPYVEEMDICLVADGESSGRVLRYKSGILGSTLLYLNFKTSEKHLRNLVFCYLKFNEEELMNHRTGSAIPHLDKSFLKNFLILLPPPPILQSFHSIVKPLFQKIILNQKQIMLLRPIRPPLLPLLVFGKLRIEEI